MFIYLSKKIAIPNNTRLNCIAWNKQNGYIAVGGDDGLLKVLKLDGGGDNQVGTKSRGLAAASNLSMNQALEGHRESVRVIAWNEIHKKLTTSDQNGVIMVWMLYKGTWYEEMVNNRKKSTVVGMAWSSDGMKICIVYEDGAVIVGAVDGNRIWGKELKGVQLSGVQWSPDNKYLLFSLHNGQVHLYDNLGNMTMKLEIKCLDSTMSEVPVAALDWYNGKYGQTHALCPSLAICYENGRMQLMCNESDNNPVIVYTNIAAAHCSWNHNGSLIAVSGKHIDEYGHANVVQFYSSFGEHLRTLKVPGLTIACCVWEGGSLRVALAVDSFVYFANIRPDYKWCYFKKTIVFTSCKPQKAGVCVSFWDISNNQCHMKYVPVLLDVAACGNHCVLVTRIDAETTTNQYGLLLCNTLGTSVDGTYINIETQWVTMNTSLVIAASKDNFIIWQYKTPKFSTMGNRGGKCRLYHIDDTPTGAIEVIKDLEQNLEIGINKYATTDAICCITSSDKILAVGRESGVIQFYALPHVVLYNKQKMPTRPYKMAINCNSLRISVIDVAGVLSVFDISPDVRLARESPDDGKLERKDVWDVCWASDNPQLLAVMEKTRMYIFKGNNPEEPITSSGYICSFHDLEVQAVLLDELMEAPDEPAKDCLIKFEVKSLRDTNQLLEKVGINEAAQFIEDNPHPRLWRLLAEAALKEMNLPMAESAFVRSHNYPGILFVKKLQTINNEAIKGACVATYFKKFDEAEKLYFECDRRDLALVLRQTLGDWFRVIQIMKIGVSAPDLILEMAYNSTADYFAQFNNWSAALEYYEMAKNRADMIECYFHLEDYDAVNSMIQTLGEGDELLKQIGDTFTIDAPEATAIPAYIKFGDIKEAINLYVFHKKWDEAKTLAQKYDSPDIRAAFTKHTVNLVDEQLLASAIEINVQTKHFLEASQITFKLAEEAIKKGKRDIVHLRKMYVLGARLVEKYATLKGVRDLRMTEGTWKGAEAYHLLTLAHRQLYFGKIHGAMLTALQLEDYTEFLSEREVYSLIAVTSFLDASFTVCSKAFMKLETIPGLNETEAEEYSKLAGKIFTHHEPRDTHVVMISCYYCRKSVRDWSTSCPSCHTRFPICMATGKSLIHEPSPVYVCNGCHHYMLEVSMPFRKTCPLCHEKILYKET